MLLLFDQLVEQILSEAFGGSGGQHGLRKGSETERRFVEALKRVGLKAVAVSSDVERTKHIDFTVFLNKNDAKGKPMRAWVDLPENQGVGANSNTVEVKGDKVKNGFLNMELRGITGHPGWLYSQGNYMSFEIEDEIVMVKTRKMKDYIERKYNFKFDTLPKIVQVTHDQNANRVFPVVFNRSVDANGRNDQSWMTRFSWDDIYQNCKSVLVFKK